MAHQQQGHPVRLALCWYGVPFQRKRPLFCIQSCSLLAKPYLWVLSLQRGVVYLSSCKGARCLAEALSAWDTFQDRLP